MCFWRISGVNVEYSVGELTIPKSFSNIGGNKFSSNQNEDRNAEESLKAKFGLALVTDEYH